MQYVTLWFQEDLKAKHVLIVAPRSAIKHNVGVEVMFTISDWKDIKEILEQIRVKEKIVFAIESNGLEQSERKG